MQHEAAVALEVLDVVLVEEFLFESITLISDTPEFGLLDNLAINVWDLQ